VGACGYGRSVRSWRYSAAVALSLSLALWVGAASAQGPRTVVSFAGTAREFGSTAGTVVLIDNTWVMHSYAVATGERTDTPYTGFYGEFLDSTMPSQTPCRHRAGRPTSLRD
jgi:hypothetical protein